MPVLQSGTLNYQGLAVHVSSGDPNTIVYVTLNDIGPTTSGTWNQNLLVTTPITATSLTTAVLESSGREVMLHSDVICVYTVGASGDVVYPSGVPIAANGDRLIPAIDFSGQINIICNTGASGTLWVWENE